MYVEWIITCSWVLWMLNILFRIVSTLNRDLIFLSNLQKFRKSKLIGTLISTSTMKLTINSEMRTRWHIQWIYSSSWTRPKISRKCLSIVKLSAQIRQAYDWRMYILPNDTVEQNRLDLQHACFRLAVDGKLYLAPIPENATILDVGCGTGKVNSAAKTIFLH
jgi:hypothetical protein